ncbi:WhiB family transcriptional regulator [Pseudonocardia sp. KRD291]|uniref:WhiB family transcriptional regulator n=1 Tax=Pseudonocardia sp. KRD291 TaxID=2792007 RepID=UPI001C4A0A8E|nr:WhiB family transcriptional regulator [Pseudonocardia sp. KRD291]MBW0100871.1 WhiB family transcriptional regulator [Pseudonocardia sp. KRD291]
MADVRRLPTPVTRIWDWQLRAACRDVDSTVFFHPPDERGPAAVARDAEAKTVCAACPVIEDCRRHALTVQEPYGVWGGLTSGERHALLNRPHRHSRTDTA